jgi:N-acetylglucosaminyl-diphospho-decaprenol L-rhamnosyltransferase
MTLSVIIVSYNVKYFLEQCLCSVQRALDNDMEVIVIDNNSSDGSVEYLQRRFAFVHFITNKENAGFAKANNLALRVATGRYVLFLNPDTIIPEDLFSECVAFMDSKPDAGALGVRMIDGSGRFLKESKRGFPSPWVAFCKMIGLTKLFPRSKTFARYYMGHLSEKFMHEVDALAGACMLVRKEVLDKTAGFDEQFFMYAEDIDLSYRIQREGYKNYYFPNTTIIHFKGESTRKDRRYVYLFYKAMIQFTRKHFKGRTSRFYVWLIGLAIWTKGKMASVGLRPGDHRKTKINEPGIMLVGEKQVTDQLALRIHPGKEVLFLNDTADVSLLKSTISKTSHKAIVFCESPGFNFKKIILLIELIKSAATFKITAAASNSIVGSVSKNIQGEVIRLQ